MARRPLQHAADTGELAGQLDKRLAEEASGPAGSFLPVARYEADPDADLDGGVSARRIRTLSSSGSSWDGVRADPGLKLMDSLPEERRWRAFPRFPLIDDGLTGGSDHARESSLADVEVSAQPFDLNVIVLGNGGPGQWHWRGGRAALSAVIEPLGFDTDQRRWRLYQTIENGMTPAAPREANFGFEGE